MKRTLSLALAVFCCLWFLVATERRAYAYVDPGSGLLALQSFAAGLAAAAYYMRRRIGAMFGRVKRAAEPAEMANPAREGAKRNAA